MWKNTTTPCNVVKPFVMRVEDSIKKGLTMINWNSLNIAKYIKLVYDAMHELKILIKRVSNFSFFSTLKASQRIGPTLFYSFSKKKQHKKKCLSKTLKNVMLNIELSLVSYHYYPWRMFIFTGIKTLLQIQKRRSMMFLIIAKAEFESDYEDFVVQVDNLQTSLQLFMDSWFERSLNTEYLLELMEKFDNIAGAM